VEENEGDGERTEEKENESDCADVHQEDDDEGTDGDEEGGEHA